ncbi:unnamed protein product, partial [Meganyctiphanes norvegica]
FISLFISLLVLVSGNMIYRKTNNPPSTNDKIHVTFNVQPSHNEFSTKKLRVPPQTSFFDIMKMAQEEDDAFRFTYNMYPGLGAYITSIGGDAEDISNGARFLWLLYNCNQDLGAAQYHDVNGCTLSDTGVSSTYPKDGEIWIFEHVYLNWV